MRVGKKRVHSPVSVNRKNSIGKKGGNKNPAAKGKGGAGGPLQGI